MVSRNRNAKTVEGLPSAATAGSSLSVRTARVRAYAATAGRSHSARSVEEAPRLPSCSRRLSGVSGWAPSTVPRRLFDRKALCFEQWFGSLPVGSAGRAL